MDRDGYPLYEGNFKDSTSHGLGTLFFKNGGRYKGYLNKGKREGTGTNYFPDGSSRVCFFSENALVNFTYLDENGKEDRAEPVGIGKYV